MTVTRAGTVVSLTALMFKRSLQLFVLALAAIVLGLLLPAAATASADSVYRDCVDDEDLDGNYSDRALREALENLPSDTDSYTDCRSIIEAAMGGRKASISTSPPGLDGAGAAGGTGAGKGSGAGKPRGARAARGDANLSPAERREQAEQRQRQLVRAETEAQLGERTVEPGSAGAIARADTANGLPLPVLLALIALSLLLLTGTALAVRRNPAIIGALRRVPLPRRRR